MKKRKIDWVSVKAAVRTAGALMAGNVFVAAFVLNNKGYVGLAVLFILGVAAIIITSIERKE